MENEIKNLTDAVKELSEQIRTLNELIPHAIGSEVGENSLKQEVYELRKVIESLNQNGGKLF